MKTIDHEEINYIEKKYNGLFLYFDLVDCIEKINYSLLPEDELIFLHECRKEYENEWYEF
jgi:hypothetical protein